MKAIDTARYTAGRETEIPAGRFFFTVRRPPILEVERARAEGRLISLEFLAGYVTGWREVRESDLIPAGDPDPVLFDAAIFQDWIKDQPDLWQPLTDGIIGLYQAHRDAIESRGNV